MLTLRHRPRPTPCAVSRVWLAAEAAAERRASRMRPRLQVRASIERRLLTTAMARTHRILRDLTTQARTLRGG